MSKKKKSNIQTTDTKYTTIEHPTRFPRQPGEKGVPTRPNTISCAYTYKAHTQKGNHKL